MVNWGESEKGSGCNPKELLKSTFRVIAKLGDRITRQRLKQKPKRTDSAVTDDRSLRK